MTERNQREQRVVPQLRDMLSRGPSNWGRWGDSDEVGAANFLTEDEVRRGMATVRTGRSFTLQLPVAHPDGDPAWPGRDPAQRLMAIDRSHFIHDRVPPFPGGIEYADDYLSISLQGTTHCDALGHAWYGDQIWNGYPAESTIGRLDKASVLPLAERGLAGRGVLLDLARHRGKESLGRGERVAETDLEDCARGQGVELGRHDILVLRTGWLNRWFTKGAAEFYRGFVEPGLSYSPSLAAWFHDREVPVLVTDTMANEVTVDPESGAALPLHGALMRDLGVVFVEMAWLEVLAADCAEDGQYDFFFTAAPLKVVGASGSPVNPLVLK